MTFKGAVAVSVIFHGSLAALALITPSPKKGGETAYYVDLIQMGPPGGPGGFPGRGGTDAGARGGKSADNGSGVALTHEAGGRMRDLTVNNTPKSSLRYPDREGRNRIEEPKLISVVRKDPKDIPSTTGGKTVGSEGLTMGIATGPGGPGGDGSGGPGGGTYFPYAYYIELLKGKISTSWYNSLVTPGLRGKFLSSVYFKIFRSGEIGELKIEDSSTIDSLDLSALRAVKNAAPFAPLPRDFPYDYLVVHFQFAWEK